MATAAQRTSDPLDAIRRKLRGYPQLSVLDTGDSIMVKAQAPEGFDVSLHSGDGEYTVSMEGWHAHFDATQIETALNCFAFGLSDTARLEVHSRGGRDYRWTLEVFEDGMWYPDSTTGLLFFWFWRMKTVRYLRNSMIVSEEISLPVEAESLSIDQTKPTAKAPLTRPSATLSPQGGRGKNERRERG